MSLPVRDESGQTVVGYSLMLVIVAIAVAAIFPPVKDAIAGVFTSVEDIVAPARAKDPPKVTASESSPEVELIQGDEKKIHTFKEQGNN